ncbi:uncharacterized protein LOC128727102 isoform X2 [Anopheles nili]|uniref:uncharacterized protein LOC128727102 isoform X2 n=1 Tax=Anopheles nili TaxID=185578 RepID=UPI00237AE764|nr:uncharacterized protein LOC128727102 isoform X2 [Anopheles nili]
MEKFVKNVNIMDETILVPCRLMDRKVGDTTDTVPAAPKAQHLGSHHGKKTNRASIEEVLITSELFEVYKMLKVVKVDLLWGRQDAEDNVEDSNTVATTNSSNTGSSSTGSEKVETNSSISPATIAPTSAKGHTRRPSTVSVASSNSASMLSDSESETSAENDSGIESEGNQEQDRSIELAKQFRTHLIGLYRSLEQMSEAANYLTARYQSDVGPV